MPPTFFMVSCTKRTASSLIGSLCISSYNSVIEGRSAVFPPRLPANPPRKTPGALVIVVYGQQVGKALPQARRRIGHILFVSQFDKIIIILGIFLRADAHQFIKRPPNQAHFSFGRKRNGIGGNLPFSPNFTIVMDFSVSNSDRE